MTDAMTDVLPTVIEVTQAFTQRLPSQRIVDLVGRIEMDVPFPELARTQPFRLIAFRKLLADHPDRDPTSLWMHSYDVEVDVIEADPTPGSEPTLMPPSALTGIASPTT
jgi:hypothetical protein